MRHCTITSVLLSAACLLAGCTVGGTVRSLATESVVVEQSAAEKATCKITADYPTGNDSLANAVRVYIAQELGRQYLPAMNAGDESAKGYSMYTGDTKDGKVVAGFYAKGNADYMRQQIKELLAAGIKDMPQLTYDISIRKTEDTLRLVSYNTTSYAFLGGAHGSSACYTVNFDKTTGKVIGQTVDTLQVKALQPILRRGVLQYLHAQGDTSITDKNLADYLFIDNGIIPLPSCTPYLAKDGLHFIYQQYEIGPYAMGMVNFTVPYADIKPYLVGVAGEIATSLAGKQ